MANKMKYGNYPNLKDIKKIKILVIKLRHFGDVLLTSSVFRVLKKEMPESQIDAFVYKGAKPILEGDPNISNILVYDRGIKKLKFFPKGLSPKKPQKELP